MQEECLYWLALTAVPGVGSVNGRALVTYAGSARKVFELPLAKLIRVEGVGEKTARAIRSFKDFDEQEKELQFSAKEGIRMVSILDEDYPRQLAECPDAPLLLYFKGNTTFNELHTLAIVGTRHATPYGRLVTEEIVHALSPYPVMIVSGMAYGIDIIAHTAALDAGLPTVAVLAHGLDRIYPVQHKATARKILANGGWLSEYRSGTLPDKNNFPRRNRIVAGMCDATLVIESAEEGGAMITAALAQGYHREVLAVPGAVTANFSRGCNKLIKQQLAQLVESAEDIVKTMGWDLDSQPVKPKQIRMQLELEGNEGIIYSHLQQKGELGIDALSDVTGMHHSNLAACLLSLECKGAISALPGKRYVAI